MEAGDPKLFSDEHSGKLLAAAVELCYWTLRSSALNAEQLRRESGLEALYKTFEHCELLVGAGSKETDMPVQVCIHVCNCFATAGLFEQCREKFCEMNAIFKSLCRLMKYEVC
jgi:DnaJ family protein C protein 13